MKLHTDLTIVTFLESLAKEFHWVTRSAESDMLEAKCLLSGLEELFRPWLSLNHLEQEMTHTRYDHKIDLSVASLVTNAHGSHVIWTNPILRGAWVRSVCHECGDSLRPWGRLLSLQTVFSEYRISMGLEQRRVPLTSQWGFWGKPELGWSGLMKRVSFSVVAWGVWACLASLSLTWVKPLPRSVAIWTCDLGPTTHRDTGTLDWSPSPDTKSERSWFTDLVTWPYAEVE